MREQFLYMSAIRQILPHAWKTNLSQHCCPIRKKNRNKWWSSKITHLLITLENKNEEKEIATNKEISNQQSAMSLSAFNEESKLDILWTSPGNGKESEQNKYNKFPIIIVKLKGAHWEENYNN